MTYIEVIIALILLTFFFFGFSQVFLPAFIEWNRAAAEYYVAHTIHFIAQSFRNECAKPNPNMENWKKTVSIAKELESCRIVELMQNESDEVIAYKAICIIAGEHIEIIGLCTMQ